MTLSKTSKTRKIQWLLVTVALVSIATKVFLLQYDLNTTVPQKGYDVTLTLTQPAQSGPISFSSYLPTTRETQTISNAVYSGTAAYTLSDDAAGAFATWTHPGANEAVTLAYSFHAEIQPRTARLSPSVYAVLRTAFDEARKNEATPNKTFAAFLDLDNTPYRWVNGLILQEHGQSVVHDWLEVRIDETWIPFDATNNFFAALPDNYLVLALSPHAHSLNNIALNNTGSNTGLTLDIVVNETYLSASYITANATSKPERFNAFHLWADFLGTGMPLVSLKVLLLIPVAAMIVAFFRNVIGLETYGVFLPALIAASGLHAGLSAALGGFLFITLLVAVLHNPMARAGLLYVPKLSFMLLTVVGILLGLALLSFTFGWSELISFSLLPLVILAISAERLSRHLDEEGPIKAAKVMGMTLLVIAACYAVISVPVVQAVLFTFPEVLLIVGACNLWLGGWLGLRLMEYHRFKWLMPLQDDDAIVARFNQHVLGINRRNAVVIHEANKRRDFVLANDKTISKHVLAEQGIPVPPTFAVLSEIKDIKAHWATITGHETFVVKPAQGLRGSKILVLTRMRGGWKTPGGTFYTPAMLQQHIADIILGSHSGGKRDKALIEQRVYPHPFFTDIYPIGLPDLRVITHEGRVVQAMLRVPTEASDGKANLCQGAIGIGVDIHTGTLQEGFLNNVYFREHPDSGATLPGRQIPFWNEILQISKHTADLMPLRYLGIDIVIDNMAGPMILEINGRPGLQIQNTNRSGLRPLLERSPVAA